MQARDAVTLTLTEVDLTEFAAWSLAPQVTAPSLRLNGAPVTLGPTVLETSFAKAAFDASCVCTDDLMATVPPNRGWAARA